MLSVLLCAVAVAIGIGDGHPGVTAVLAFRDVTDTRERQVGGCDKVSVFHKISKSILADTCCTVLILVVGDGHGGLRELYRRDVDNIADKGDFLAFTIQRIEGRTRRMARVNRAGYPGQKLRGSGKGTTLPASRYGFKVFCATSK